MSLAVEHSGLLALLQDDGRYGQHHLGLTTGGPMDKQAFDWCQRLLDNTANATLLELHFGGFKARVQAATRICVTGADCNLSINGTAQELWRSHRVQAGDHINIGNTRGAARVYLGVAGGFDVEPQFGSTATVLREGIGGQDGAAVKAGDTLPYRGTESGKLWRLPTAQRPTYCDVVTLRLVPGYQQARFDRSARRRFFSSEYRVSNRCDRMGYRLEGPAINGDSSTLLSEGICLGAVQIPADGQPIVLLQDRQTIGGYPKIGAVLSLDISLLAQLPPGGRVHFVPVSIQSAHNALLLDRYRRSHVTLQPCA